MSSQKSSSIFEPSLLVPALLDSMQKLNPLSLLGNPVMLVVEVGCIVTTCSCIAAAAGSGGNVEFNLAISAWLWATLLFANFAESLAEGRGKAQAKTLRAARQDVLAKKLDEPRYGGEYQTIKASDLRRGDLVLVEPGDIIPGDGEALEGIASVDESAITGESAPVIREAGGDRSSVTGGTRVLSDWLVIEITANPGETFLDRMISMVEGAKRQKTPNEIALNILLTGLTLIFLLVTVTMYSFSAYSARAVGQTGIHTAIDPNILVALLVCLIPTTIGGLLSAIGIAGMDRLIRANVIAMSGRAVEAAGDIDMLLLDKTGTITLGNREATKFYPASGISQKELADAAQLASLADDTPEGRSIVVLAKNEFGIRARNINELGAHFVPFTAQTRMSGVDFDGRQIRKGSCSAISDYLVECGRALPQDIRELSDSVASKGSTPLVVADKQHVLGVVELKDIVKGGIRERFAELRAMGIRTIMITGDNKLTAASIAAEAGVDDYLAEATPEQKLEYIRDAQAKGYLVAMTGDGTNDAPALAQADVAVAMNSGTQAAKEASNMVDLDSSPTKLIEIVEIGKQLLMTRGSLTTFSIANDVAKYFAIIPAAFSSVYPELGLLNIMQLATPESAILSAVIFNALIILILLPLALQGVPYKPVGADQLLRENLIIYGIGGVIAPFAGIKLIDLALSLLGARG
ncbi:MAG: potassium-transporting ATPase subunit KdpB [Candidatus Obscuribacterales bacterium]